MRVRTGTLCTSVDARHGVRQAQRINAALHAECVRAVHRDGVDARWSNFTRRFLRNWNTTSGTGLRRCRRGVESDERRAGNEQ